MKKMFDTNEKLLTGLETAKKVALEREKHSIGEAIKVRGIKGRVIGIYPHFLEVLTDNYIMSVSYKDLVIKEVLDEPRSTLDEI